MPDLPNFTALTPALEEALLKQIEAETAVSIEDKRLRAAEARKAEAYAVSQEKSMRDSLRAEELSLADDHYHHELAFTADVNERSVRAALMQLATWHRLDATCPMKIIMDSPGGSVVDGFHLFDEIVGYSERGGGTHKVTITVRGYAASMAGILLQAADERVMGKEAYVLVHQVSSWAQGSIGDLKDKVKWLDMMSARVVNLFLERAGDNITREEFEKNWERKDWWVASDEALRLGLVDRLG